MEGKPSQLLQRALRLLIQLARHAVDEQHDKLVVIARGSPREFVLRGIIVEVRVEILGCTTNYALCGFGRARWPPAELRILHYW